MIRLNISRAVLLAALVIAAPASALEYTRVITDKSNITFTSRQMGVPVAGRFSTFTASLAFDPAKPEATKIQISVDLGSIDAGSTEANDEVIGKPWFNTRMFPVATFASQSVKSIGAGKFELTGTLGIKGKSQPIKAVFVQKPDETNAAFDGSFTIKRIDFGIGEGEWADVGTVANEVQVNFHIVATASAAAAKSK